MCGWVRTNRVAKKLCFMSINDGSCQANLQLVLEKDKLDPAAWEAAKGAGNGAAVRVAGPLKLSPKEGQKWELPVGSIEIVGPSDGGSYPIPPAKINLETLRGLTHMRPRTGVMGAVMRVRIFRIPVAFCRALEVVRGFEDPDTVPCNPSLPVCAWRECGCST